MRDLLESCIEEFVSKLQADQIRGAGKHLSENIFHRAHADVLSIDQLVDHDRLVESKLYTIRGTSSILI